MISYTKIHYFEHSSVLYKEPGDNNIISPSSVVRNRNFFEVEIKAFNGTGWLIMQHMNLIAGSIKLQRSQIK
jgi:hypothetical protein